MYQAKSGKQPPATMQAAIAAVKQTRMAALAMGVANFGALPRGLNASDAKTVTQMARAIQTARNPTIHN